MYLKIFAKLQLKFKKLETKKNEISFEAKEINLRP